MKPPIPFDAIPILASIRAEDRAFLEPLCQLRGYDRGETIFREGDPSTRIHFIHFGRVKIVKAAAGRDVILEILGAGEPIGAPAAFEGRPFPATAVTLETTAIVSIPESEFFALLERRPEIVRQLLAGLTLRLMTLNKRLVDMTGSVEHRLARLFVTLAEKLGRRRPDGSLEIPLAISRQELADLVGTTIETAIRVMSRWQKADVVRSEADGFRVPSLDDLRRLAG